MCATVTLVGLLTAAPMVYLPTAFWQITPYAAFAGGPTRDKDRATVLIHGLVPHTGQSSRASIPEAHTWQKSDALIVKRLGCDADVYGFSYAQTLPVDCVCRSQGLRMAVAKLKSLGYKEIVLVGHSAGGVIARQFAENFPDSGVTKVICVATPHAGSPWAMLPQFGLAGSQLPFIKSLAPSYRQSQTLCCKPLANWFEVCCVVCKLPRLSGDTVVPATSQWPEDLQKQGIPAALIRQNHFDVMRTPEGAELIAGLAREKLTRWSTLEVELGRRMIAAEKDAREKVGTKK